MEIKNLKYFFRLSRNYSLLILKMRRQVCVLQSSSPNYPSIEVETKKTIGRSPETCIQAAHCSKQHRKSLFSFFSSCLTALLLVCLTPKFEDDQEPVLLINRLGTNSSQLNGKTINLFGVVEARQGDKLEVVLGLDFHYIIDFPEAPDVIAKKRSASPEKENKKMELPIKKPRCESWQEIQGGKLHIFTANGVCGSQKIAAYDLDWTIIKTKSGNVFAKNIDDWQIAFTEVPGKLKSLIADGFKVVFFTNQAGIGSGKFKLGDFKNKIERIVAKLNVPVQVFASTGKGIFRKPIPGMWDFLVEQENDGLKVDLAESFFCGDAAGRPEMKKPVKRKKDFSNSDRLFALNVGVSFFTPEEHFQGKRTEDYTKPEFDPRSTKQLPLTIPASAKLALSTQEVIIFVGSPASGKSYFAKTHFKDYIYINRDTLGTWQKCVAALERAIQEGKSAVIDNTNPDAESRKRYIDAAKKHKVPCRCFLMLTSERQAKHNNVFRELIDPSHAVLGEMVFVGYRSKFKEPALKEGFQEIVRANFVPKFDNEEHEKLYKMYLTDK